MAPIFPAAVMVVMAVMAVMAVTCLLRECVAQLHLA